jgi:hypothetical protein
MHVISEITDAFPNAANYRFMLDLIAIAEKCRSNGTKVGTAYPEAGTVHLM